MLISKTRETLGRLSPCMTNVLRSHRIFLVAVIIVHPFDAIFPFLPHLRWHHRRRHHSPLLFSFPFSSSTLLLSHSSITIFFEQTDWSVRSQSLLRFFQQPASSIYFSISHKSFCVYRTYRTRYIDISTYHIHIHIDKSRFQAIFKLSRVDRVRGS